MKLRQLLDAISLFEKIMVLCDGMVLYQGLNMNMGIYQIANKEKPEYECFYNLKVVSVYTRKSVNGEKPYIEIACANEDNKEADA